MRNIHADFKGDTVLLRQVTKILEAVLCRELGSSLRTRASRLCLLSPLSTRLHLPAFKAPGSCHEQMCLRRPRYASSTPNCFQPASSQQHPAQLPRTPLSENSSVFTTDGGADSTRSMDQPNLSCYTMLHKPGQLSH